MVLSTTTSAIMHPDHLLLHWDCCLGMHTPNKTNIISEEVPKHLPGGELVLRCFLYLPHRASPLASQCVTSVVYYLQMPVIPGFVYLSAPSPFVSNATRLGVCE